MRVLNSLSNDIHVEHVVKTPGNPRVGLSIMVGSFVNRQLETTVPQK